MNELKLMRKEIGFSQKDMADFLCLNYDTYRHMEAARRPIRPVYKRMLELISILASKGLLKDMNINPLRFHIRMTPGGKFAVFDSFRRYDAGVFIEYEDAAAFKAILIEREERKHVLTDTVNSI